MDATLCSTAWTRDGNLKHYNYVRHSGETDGIVGITFNGVPIHIGTSELGYDAFFPNSYGGRKTPKKAKVDICLGSSDHSSYYKYYSFSPCILETATKHNYVAAMCDELEECDQNVR